MLGQLASEREKEVLDVLRELENPTSWNILYTKLGGRNFSAYSTALKDLVSQGLVIDNAKLLKTADASRFSIIDP